MGLMRIIISESNGPYKYNSYMKNALYLVASAKRSWVDFVSVTPHPDEVHSTCNCKDAYVHQVPL